MRAMILWVLLLAAAAAASAEAPKRLEGEEREAFRRLAARALAMRARAAEVRLDAVRKTAEADAARGEAEAALEKWLAARAPEWCSVDLVTAEWTCREPQAAPGAKSGEGE